MICCFEDFCRALRASGFSMGGGNPKGIYAAVDFTWENQAEHPSPVRWHTGDPETDPWEWRIRVLDECGDIAYAKLFFRTSGFITAEWYPRFLAVRRQGESFEEAYFAGRVSHEAKRIYEAVSRFGQLPLHDIKTEGGFRREENSWFERALVELQMGMFLTMCGRVQKISRKGEPYGWNSTVFTTTERFWEERGISLYLPDPQQAYEQIRERILLLNPAAQVRNIDRFIRG